MFEPKGTRATSLRKRRFDLVQKLRIPSDALPGSLALTHGRCGKETCHCADGRGHGSWSLTFMVRGKKRVERIPEEWVEEVRRRVDEGREFREALSEVLTTNAELVVLARRQRHR